MNSFKMVNPHEGKRAYLDFVRHKKDLTKDGHVASGNGYKFKKPFDTIAIIVLYFIAYGTGVVSWLHGHAEKWTKLIIRGIFTLFYMIVTSPILLILLALNPKTGEITKLGKKVSEKL